jgi:anion-transporting  ArsA/GET3 family ATPase
VSAALARSAAAHGSRTLLVEVEGKAAAHLHFDAAPLTYRPSVLLPAGPRRAEVRGRSLTPDDALVDYLEGHGMHRVARRLARNGALEVIATATPGIKDILVLGKVKQLANEGDSDLIVLDAPAAGHAVSFLRAAVSLRESTRSGPIRQQAEQVLAMLTDPRRCQVVLVTIPEETPVNELVETAYSLEDEVGVRLGPVVVNGVYPELPEIGRELQADDPATAAAAAFRLRRTELQQVHRARLKRELPLEQIVLPFDFAHDAGAEGSALLAEQLTAALHALPDRPHAP